MAEGSYPSSRPKRWYRKAWFISLTSVVAVLLVAGGVVGAVVVTNRHKAANSTPHTPTLSQEIKRWWAGASEDFTELRRDIDEMKRIAGNGDIPGQTAVCQKIEETSAVKLTAHLSSPDPTLTAEVKATADDAHSGAHIGLALLAAGEFISAYDNHRSSDAMWSFFDQATVHMQAAQDIINRNLTSA
jgi:hypothetical protein